MPQYQLTLLLGASGIALGIIFLLLIVTEYDRFKHWLSRKFSK